MENNENNFLLISQIKFWEDDIGSCMIIKNILKTVPSKKIFLLLPFKIDDTTKKELLDRYHLADVLCISTFWIFFVRCIRGLLYKLNIKIPYFLLKPYHYSIFTQKKLHSYCLKNDIKTVQIEYIWFSNILKCVQKDPNIQTIIETGDIQHLFTSNLKKKFGKAKNFITKEDEINILNNFDLVTGVSKEDVDYFQENLKTKVLYLPPLIVDENYLQFKHNLERKFHIGYIAGNTDFNYDSIAYFINNVFNIISDNFDIQLDIYGSICKRLRNDLTKNNKIKLHGYVNSVSNAYINSNVMINSTFQIGGIKIKNLESLYYSTPVITSPLGERGFKGASKTKAMYVCKTDEEYINTITMLINNPQYIIDGQKDAFEYIKENFGKEHYNSYYNCLEIKK